MNDKISVLLMYTHAVSAHAGFNTATHWGRCRRWSKIQGRLALAMLQEKKASVDIWGFPPLNNSLTSKTRIRQASHPIKPESPYRHRRNGSL